MKEGEITNANCHVSKRLELQHDSLISGSPYRTQYRPERFLAPKSVMNIAYTNI